MIPVAPATWAVKSDRREVPIGDLLCRVEQVQDTEAETSSQKRGIDCVFQRSSSGNLEHYSGTFTVVGVDSLLKNNRVVSWVVRGSPDLDGQPGALEQSYSDKSDGETLSLAGDERPSLSLLESSKTDPKKRKYIIRELQLWLQMTAA
jgi:hypothetical protein